MSDLGQMFYLRTLRLVCILVFSSVAITSGYFEYKYSLQRNLLQEKEREFSGNHDVLTPDEVIVDNYLEYLKWAEFQATRDNFPPSRPIQDVLSQIRKSDVYRVLKSFPKGGNMHLHLNHILSKQKMLDMIYDDADLFDHLCVNTQSWILDFYITPPSGWVHVKSNMTLYSRERILQHITLLNVLDQNATSNPTDSGIRWTLMGPMFGKAGSTLVKYANYSRMHMKAVFQSALDENVQYLEARGSSWGLYTLDDNSPNGHRYIDNPGRDHWFQLVRDEIAEFKKTHPEFIGYREIMNGRRYKNQSQVKGDMDLASTVFKKYPDIIGGYDLVAEEDQGHSLLFFIEDFAKMAAKNDTMPYYFHTAETNWPSDILTSLHADDPVSTLDNVYEAIILGAKRVGHGLGFIKHPYLMEVLKEKKIAIETNPVSNMLLGYVTDQRHHPSATYIRYGIPVVLGADDPGTMGYNEFTVDWYEAFMGWGLNLVDLKQLAKNSLNYSMLSAKEKVNAFQKWDSAWAKYITAMKQEACNISNEASLAQPEFYSIYPHDGHVTSQTKVRIFGRHFERAICHDIVCKFGNSVSAGRFVYTSMITCSTTARLNGLPETVPFSISFNGGADFYSTNLEFTYMHTINQTDPGVTSILVG